MQIKSSLVTLILIGLIIAKCAIIPPPPLPITEVGPNVRIGIAEKLESLSFTTNGNVDIWDQDDRLMISDFESSTWKVELVDTAPVNLRYRLLYREVSHREVAERLKANLEDGGQTAVIKQIKQKIFQGDQFGTVLLYQIFLNPVFYSEDEALQYQQQISTKFATTILPFFDARPKGRIILINEDTGDRFQSPGLIRIRSNLFTFKVGIGEGYHFEQQTARTYHYELEFWIDRFGKLTVVNEIPLEVYLKGVVGSEMHPDFPLEALKAQAVASRGYTLARVGKQHRLSPFDLCDDVHCQVYGGVGRESPQVNKAVDNTRGQILMYEDRICDTFYAGVCGGHTEGNEHVWSSELQPYLRGHLDSRMAHLLPEDYLKNESQVRQWIESSPDVYCNTLRQQAPEYLDYTKKYFRWSVRYSREELSRIIAEKSGQNIGTLVEITPEERGVSGRIKKLRLRGTLKTIIVEKELEIRRVLSSNYLYSSCFVVDREGNNFVLMGAGWGHGVGLCQTGAAMMALQGFDYRDILNHYYTNSNLKKLY